jgi:hypothetical protein
MPQNKEVQVKTFQEQTVTAIRMLITVLIIGDGNIYWEVYTIYNNEVLKKEWYNVPFAELAGLETNGGTFLQEIEATLWEKSDEIDAMPETTVEERIAKNLRYGIMYSYHINN